MITPAKRKGSPEAMDVDPGSTSKKPRKMKPSSPSTSKVGKSKSKSHAAQGEFRAIKASVVLTIPPVFASRPRDGAEEMLDSLVMRYEPTLRGVVLAHSNLQFLESVGRVQADSPFAVCNVGFESMVWSPELGMKLTGRINLSSPDHVSLLVHRTFNVSIPRHHIPTDQWEFEYGPAENDPEFGEVAQEVGAEVQKDAAVGEGVEEKKVGNDGAVEGEGAEDTDAHKRGRWIHKITGERLGGEERVLEFTVVGLTIANQMLSLVGSIQPDPFSPAHVPQPAARAHSPVRASSPPLDTVEADVSDDEKEDVFAELARAGGEAQRKAQEQRAKAAVKKREKEEKKKAKEERKAGKEERKRKRREEKEAEDGDPGKQTKRSKS